LVSSLDFDVKSNSDNYSEKSQDFINLKSDYVEYRQQQQMLLERKNRYQHTVVTVVLDKLSQKY
jgi:hypothetical protein